MSVHAGKISFTACLTLVFLALPSLIFLNSWISQPAGILTSLCLVITLALIFYEQTERKSVIASLRQSFLTRRAALCFCIAALWVFSSGIGHFLYANIDWHIRDMVLRDLTVGSWPIGYNIEPTQALILRMPLGYYLMPALIGKMGGLAIANYALVAETIIGVFLFFMLITEHTAKPRDIIIVLLTGVLFSAMDSIGQFTNYLWRLTLKNPNVWPANWPWEWWAWPFQYSSLTTQLYWVPNHALSGWLAAALWWRYRDDPAILAIGPLTIAVCLLWSPLSAFGLLPLAGYSIWQHRRELQHHISLLTFTAPLLVVAIVMHYDMLDTNHVQHNLILISPHIAFTYFFFVLLTFGLLIACLYRQQRDPLLVLIAVFLAVLPIYNVGSGDLTMRSSIPALVVLALITANRVTAINFRKLDASAITMIVLLMLGAVTPVFETYRSYTYPRWVSNPDCNLSDALNERGLQGDFVNYTAHIRMPPLLLKNPEQLIPRRVNGEACQL